MRKILPCGHSRSPCMFMKTRYVPLVDIDIS
jgi:hypothetical protein